MEAGRSAPRATIGARGTFPAILGETRGDGAAVLLLLPAAVVAHPVGGLSHHLQRIGLARADAHGELQVATPAAWCVALDLHRPRQRFVGAMQVDQHRVVARLGRHLATVGLAAEELPAHRFAVVLETIPVGRIARVHPHAGQVLVAVPRLGRRGALATRRKGNGCTDEEGGSAHGTRLSITASERGTRPSAGAPPDRRRRSPAAPPPARASTSRAPSSGPWRPRRREAPPRAPRGCRAAYLRSPALRWRPARAPASTPCARCPVAAPRRCRTRRIGTGPITRRSPA